MKIINIPKCPLDDEIALTEIMPSRRPLLYHKSIGTCARILISTDYLGRATALDKLVQEGDIGFA